jgi:hypothetical protein
VVLLLRLLWAGLAAVTGVAIAAAPLRRSLAAARRLMATARMGRRALRVATSAAMRCCSDTSLLLQGWEARYTAWY